MRDNIKQVGMAVTSLANCSYNLKKGLQHQNSQIVNQSVKEIAQKIELINSLFNDVHVQMMQNDENVQRIQEQF